MKMENLAWPWRVWAKVVGIVDVVLLVIASLSVIFYVMALPDEINDFVLCVAIFVIVIQMCSAFTLLSATKVGNETKMAYNRARIWTIVAGIFAILSFIGNLVQLNAVGLVLLVLWRGLGFWVVYKFMQELETGGA